MRSDIANIVHPVFRHALDLRERVCAGEKPNFDTEQATLKAMLLTEHEAQRISGFGGDTVDESESESDEMQGWENLFLGIRYALVCWLDELFVLHSPWEKAWNEQKLEMALYGTNDRAWKFWEQAKRAESQAGVDALEVFYLCVVLGFRGVQQEKPEEVATWLSSTHSRLMQILGQDWQAPPELEPVTYVPPLHARERLQTVVMVGGMALLLLVPIVLFLVVRDLGQ